MKLISLNTWGGQLYETQVDFLKRHMGETDIFCFQEVYNDTTTAANEEGTIGNMFSIYEKILSDFNGFHAEAGKFPVGSVPNASYGIAMFVRKAINISDSGFREIFKADEKLDLKPGIVLCNRLLQFVTLPYKDAELTIYNLHGLYTGGGKNDTPDRLEQSKRVRDFMSTKSGEKILCGDFNLAPDTESLKILESEMRNLIKENGITSTRSHHYKKDLRLADYMIVSKGIEVKKFEVLQDVVSDHLPMLLEF